MSKFVKRFWSLFIDRDDNFLINDELPTDEELKILHKTIRKVTDDIKNLSFNTAISAMMVFVNEMKRLECYKREILMPALRLIAPFAPFISEELWYKTGNDKSIHKQSFPVYEEKYLAESVIEYPICINGKKRKVS